MKKITALLLLIVSSILLVSCSEDDLPEGMQLIRGGEEYGYYFYAPEEWTSANLGEISAAYASNIDNTSVTFAEVDKSTFPLTDGVSAEDYFFNSYFNASLSEFPVESKPNVTVNGEEPCLFGSADAGADRAKKYVYDYTYADHPFGFMQIFVSHDDSYYIFTYSAQKTKRTEGDETTRYDFYIENGKLQSIIDNFKFVKKSSASAEKTEPIKDSDGYILSTDKDLAGFELYLPESFKVDFTSGIVSASHDDGSNVTLTKATRAGVAADTYWKERQEELSSIATNIEIIKEAEQGKLGNNSEWAFIYEYTFDYNGAKYHVYQILAVDGFLFFGEGYTFTYTAKEENYQKHFGEIEKIINKVTF